MATEANPALSTIEMRCFCGPVLLNLWHYRAPKCITLGEAKGCDVFVSAEGLPCPAFPLVRELDGSYFLTLTAQMHGELRIGEMTTSLPVADASLRHADPDLEGAYNVALPTDALCLVHWGGVSLALRFCDAPAKIPRTWFAALDGAFVNSVSFAACVHVAVITALLLQPRDVKALQPDIFTDPGRMGMLILTPPAPKPSHAQFTRPLPREMVAHPPRAKPSTSGGKLPVARPTPGLSPSKPSPERQPHADVESMRDWMQTNHHLGPNKSTGLLPGGGELTLPTVATGLPEVHGSIGTGSGLAHPGGSIGVGAIDTRHGDAPASLGLTPTHRPTLQPIELQPAQVAGALAPDVILAVINQQRAQIRFCYEKSLQRHQDLSGRILIAWIITATGETTQVHVEESTMDDPSVGECMVEHIQTWRFSSPAGGGTVQVRYPWVFRPS